MHEHGDGTQKQLDGISARLDRTEWGLDLRETPATCRMKPLASTPRR